jgi:hypothetical protein
MMSAAPLTPAQTLTLLVERRTVSDDVRRVLGRRR